MSTPSKVRRIALLPLALSLLVIAACSESDGDGITETETLIGLDPNVPPVTSGDWYRPDRDARWHYELRYLDIDRIYEMASEGETEIIVLRLSEDIWALRGFRDELGLEEHPKIFCHFAAGALGADDPGFSSLPENVIGNAVAGDSDRRWVDVRSEHVFKVALTQVLAAVEAGCEGVVPANVDGHLYETGLSHNSTNWLAFNRHLANAARERGLTVLLKNNGAQAADLVEYFDGQLTENCFSVTGCSRNGSDYFRSARTPILNAELAADRDTGRMLMEMYCKESIEEGIQTLIAPVGSGDSFRYTCWSL
jgi:hypothetical protein